MRPLFHFALGSGPALFLPGQSHTGQGGESHETEPEGQVHGVAGGGGEGLAAEVTLAVLIGVRMARGREETGLGFAAGALTRLRTGGGASGGGGDGPGAEGMGVIRADHIRAVADADAGAMAVPSERTKVLS